MKRDHDITEPQKRRMYAVQKASAKQRGIDWLFTYETWLQAWGEKINHRGVGHDRLCMQRFGDVGPYSPENVKIGYARDNAKTAGVVKRHRNIARNYRLPTQDQWDAIYTAVKEAEANAQ